MPLGLRLVRGMEILSETQSRIIGQAERQYMQRLRGMDGFGKSKEQRKEKLR